MRRITIVGCGALGSHVALLLRNVDAGLRVIDMDRIESKNILSQFHGRPGLGKNKAQSFGQVMQHLFGVRPGVKLEPIPHKLTKDNETQLLGGSNLIIDCLDNFEARDLVQRFSAKNNIPCLHGGLAPNGEYGRVVWSEDFKIDAEPGTGAATCEDGEHLPFIAITSAFLAQAAKVFLNSGKRIGFEVSPVGVRRT